ncbi:hypothetical protein DFH11DRAFT_1830309 [Phellopilus nigrolimitatus]|nr:hypothetical protein DFH11DRAFT_1830309 [Phellopilus nigrolimitatus]
MHPQEKGHTRLTSRKVCNAFCSLKLLVINDWRKAKGRSQRGILYTELASLLDVELFSGIQTQHDSHYLSHFDLTAHPGYAHLRRHQRLIDSVHGPRLPATCPATPASALLIRTYVGAYDSGCRLCEPAFRWRHAHGRRVVTDYLPPVFGRRRAGEMVRSLWEEDVKKEKGRRPAWGLTGAVEVEREAHANSGQPKEAKLEELEMVDPSSSSAPAGIVVGPRSAPNQICRKMRHGDNSSPAHPAPRTKSNASSFAPAFGLVISASQLHRRPNQSSQQPATPRARALTSSGVNLVVICGVEGKLLVPDRMFTASSVAGPLASAPMRCSGSETSFSDRSRACVLISMREEVVLRERRNMASPDRENERRWKRDERDECEHYERQRERTWVFV